MAKAKRKGRMNLLIWLSVGTRVLLLVLIVLVIVLCWLALKQKFNLLRTLSTTRKGFKKWLL